MEENTLEKTRKMLVRIGKTKTWTSPVRWPGVMGQVILRGWALGGTVGISSLEREQESCPAHRAACRELPSVGRFRCISSISGIQGFRWLHRPSFFPGWTPRIRPLPLTAPDLITSRSTVRPGRAPRERSWHGLGHGRTSTLASTAAPDWWPGSHGWTRARWLSSPDKWQ